MDRMFPNNFCSAVPRTGQLGSKLYSYQVTRNLKYATVNIFATSVQCRLVLRGCLFNSFMNNQNFN